MSPSRVKIGSGSTRTSGYWPCSSPAEAQCVVARRPSSRPAAASRNAPVHTDAVLLDLAEASTIHSSKRSSLAASTCPAPPARISVSSGSGASRRLACGVIVRPLEVRSGRPSGLTISTR